MADKYYVETYEMKHKICPLTGIEAQGWVCNNVDCSNVSGKEEYDIVHGIPCYCAEDVRRANEEYEIYQGKEQQRKIANEKMLISLQNARHIDYDKFDDYCKELDKSLMANNLKFDKNLSIKPFVDKDEHRVMYLMNNGVVEDISITSNILTTLNKWKTKLSDPVTDYSFSMQSIPSSLVEIIQINLYLRHNIDVARVLKYDNPIYLNKKSLGKYIDAVYGWNWHTFKKARAMHLEMTEIVNGDNLIFIKQEIDEIVRRQSMLQNV